MEWLITIVAWIWFIFFPLVLLPISGLFITGIMTMPEYTDITSLLPSLLTMTYSP